MLKTKLLTRRSLGGLSLLLAWLILTEGTMMSLCNDHGGQGLDINQWLWLLFRRHRPLLDWRVRSTCLLLFWFMLWQLFCWRMFLQYLYLLLLH